MGPRAVQRPPETDPPVWLLALGCVALGLMLAGVLLGGETGDGLLALGCVTFLPLACGFLSRLAVRYLRPPNERGEE